MGFLDLIKQDNGIWFPAHCFGELTAFLIADISWRCSDETGDGIFLHIFTHIDTHHVVFVIKQAFGKGFGKLCLSNPGRTKEKEGADGLCGILNRYTYSG